MRSFFKKKSSSASGDRTTSSYSAQPHTLSAERVASELQTSISTGLSDDDAQNRLERDGENVLEGDGGVSALHVLLRQMANALTLILVAACALSFGVKDWVEGGVITAVVLLNIITGFYQEYRAEQTMSSLRSLSSPTASVTRSSTSTTVPSKHVVIGDIISFKPGDSIPADGRLIEAVNLEIDEMLLTGESLPVAKSVERLQDPDLGVGDRLNMVWSSTVVAKGRGKAVVTATGMDTQIGRIAESLGNKKGSARPSASGEEPKKPSILSRAYHGTKKALGLEDGTPLQIKLSQIAYILFLVAIVLAIIVFAVAEFNVTGDVAVYAIAVGISIVPESLILVLTTTMAAGTRRMAKSNVIVRKTDALEALGGVSDICSDKTGTITQGKMIARKVWLPTSGEYTIESGEEALSPTGSIVGPEDQPVGGDAKVPEDLDSFARSASLCNVATIFKGKDGRWAANGDPTEVALQVFCHKLSLGRPSLIRTNPDDDEQDPSSEKAEAPAEKTSNPTGRYELKVEFPFDSSVKRMTTIYYDHEHASSKLPSPLIAYSKGAVERILSSCKFYRSSSPSSPDSTSPMTSEFETEILSRMEDLASQGLRVLAFASKYIQQDDKNGKWERAEVEKDFTFLGIAGLYDPPRLESKEAIKTCMDAGIVVRMLTGDHPATAKAIAKEVGLITNSSPATAVFTAAEFDKLSDQEIDDLPELPLVIARCAPETKVRMIAAGKRRGRYMAMTGDGVNDSPSLKQAPIGIAMGLAGSDVAKDASDLVLTDDNFASIVQAIAEGRRIFDNIKRFILVLLAANVGQVIALIIGLAFQDSEGASVFPLSPLQILWINMLTSPGPSLGLGLEKPAADVMTRPPHDLKAGVFTWEVIVDTILYGFVSGATCLANFVIVVYGVGNGDLGYRCNEDYETCDLVFRARATVFATMMFQLLILAWEAKSFSRSMFALTPGVPFWKTLYENKVLFWSVIFAAATAPALIYIPVLNRDVFQMTGIGYEWGLIAAAVIIFVAVIEIYKMTLRKRWFGTPKEWEDKMPKRLPSLDTKASVESNV